MKDQIYIIQYGWWWSFYGRRHLLNITIKNTFNPIIGMMLFMNISVHLLKYIFIKFRSTFLPKYFCECIINCKSEMNILYYILSPMWTSHYKTNKSVIVMIMILQFKFIVLKCPISKSYPKSPI